MAKIDAVALGRRAYARDVMKTRSRPALLEIKLRKMLASPFAFLRGAPAAFYEALAQAPDLAAGPSGEGVIVGDSHLENFGAYRSRALPGDKEKRQGRVVFDVNDFDDACVGPHRFDLVRLATSLLLAARVHGAPGDATLALLASLFEGYARGAFEGVVDPPPPCVRRLVARAEARSEREFLGSRTTGRRGRRRLALGARYLPLEARVREALPAALARYAAGLSPESRPRPEELELLDAAFRVAGNGSLGCLRVAVLVRGRDDGGWLFDLKEESRAPSPRRLATVPDVSPAERVYTAYRACVERVPSRLGTTTLLGRTMLARRLTPQEDKLDVVALRPRELHELVPHVGALLGRAHARGATRPGRPHTRAEREAMAERASVLAGLHETAFLAYAARAAAAARAR